MAAFTTLALLGLAAAGGITAGSALARKKAGDQGDDVASRTIGGPHANAGAPPAQPPTAPPALAQTASAAALAGSVAANRQRKRAGAGASLLSEPTTNTKAAPKLQPLTLLGY